MSTALAKRPLPNLSVERRAEIALEVLQAYEQGQEVADLAPNYGVSDVTLYALLIRDHEEAWKTAQVSRALCKRDQATSDLSELRLKMRNASEQPLDALSLAQVREQVRLAEVQAKRAEWELERVYRRIYGQDVPADAGRRVSITLNLGGAGATIAPHNDVEGTVLASTTSKA
jgi:hypothetical protein